MTARSRTRSRRGEGERLREAILDAAADLLDATYDVESLSVRTVTAAAGVSPTALYLHFDDKKALVQAVKLRCFAALGASIRAAGSAHADDPAARLRAMAAAYLRYAAEHPGHYAMLLHVGSRTPPPANPPEALRTAGDEVFALLTQAIVDHRGCDAATAFEAACVLWLGLHGRAHIAQSMPWVPLPGQDGYVDLLVTHALDGVGVRPL